MNEDPMPKTMDEVIEKVRLARQEFAAKWSGLSEKQMTQLPGPQSDWSVKDLIGHILWWEKYALAHVAIMAAGEPAHRIKDYDAVNARVYAQNKDIPLAKMLQLFDEHWLVIEGLLKSLSAEDLAQNERAWGLLRADTFGHYEEHSEDLDPYLASLK
jgi:mannose-6-phosphate isomerase-like protein (cupin superfamily)